MTTLVQDYLVLGGGSAGCDASLMLTIPRANTNTPPLMLAERIADLIRG